MQIPLDLSYREIPLTRGQVAIVDADLYEELNAWKWCALPRRSGGFYAYRGINKGRTSTLRIFMHRQIMGLEQSDPLKVDHRDPLKTLDNRRENLRIATCSQNKANQAAQRNNKSGLKGVSWDRGGWRAYIQVGGKLMLLGKFSDKYEAHAAYCKAADYHFGEFARFE